MSAWKPDNKERRAYEMEIYVIKWSNGDEERFNIFSMYRFRMTEIRAAGRVSGKDFTTWTEEQ